MESQSVVQMCGVVKRFGARVAVDRLDLEIPRGCIFGVLGPNGAGKTTTLRMLMSIFMPDAGSIRVLGHASPEAVKDRLGYLPEEKGLYKKMRVAEMIAYFGRLKGMSAADAKRRTGELLAQHGLAERANDKCEALSKGNQQKVQVLGTVVHDPDLVILDEPFSGLDPVNAQTLRDTMHDIRRSGRTVIFSTHVMEHAEQLCDALVIFKQGRKIREGTLGSLKAQEEPTVIVETDGDLESLRGLASVRTMRVDGRVAEIGIAPGGDAQEILRTLVARGARVLRFDMREPSLQEIFIRSVGEAA